MTKDQRTIKAQAVQIDELKNKVESLKSDLESTSKIKSQYDNELSDIHRTFDLLGVPKRVKNQYHDLSANARLTLFMAQTHGIPVAQPKEEDF
jgi:predicted RNase H-like nuclease (RuvC/YqgF family)